MKIVVTGGTGFIGKHLIRRLTDDGHEVILGTTPGRMLSSDYRSYVFGEKTMQEDIDFLKEENISGIIHLASLFLASHTPKDITGLIQSNVLFGSQLLEAASNANTKWFINTGTFWQNYNNAEYSPVNLYAATKQAFCDIAQYYVETNKLKFNTIKLCDTFGPEDTRTKIFTLWNKIAETGESIDMSAGEQQIDISYIDDVVDAFICLMNLMEEESDLLVNGADYAVKADKRYTLKELAEAFEKATGKTLHIYWGKREYREREVMIPWEKGESIPGWHPKVSIEEGIRKSYFIK